MPTAEHDDPEGFQRVLEALETMRQQREDALARAEVIRAAYEQNIPNALSWGISQRELARRLGITHSAVAKILKSSMNEETS